MKCPDCKSEIPSKELNIQTDIAQCSNCQKVFKISDALNIVDDDFDMHDPPQGAWIKTDTDGILLGATTRAGVAFFFLPFLIVGTSLAFGIGHIVRLVLPEELQFVLTYLYIPIGVITTILWGGMLYAIFGKVVLTLNKQGGKIFTGMGFLGITKRFTWDNTSSIKERLSNTTSNGEYRYLIQLEGRKNVSFGTWLTDQRRSYILQSLRQTLLKAKSNKLFF